MPQELPRCAARPSVPAAPSLNRDRARAHMMVRPRPDHSVSLLSFYHLRESIAARARRGAKVIAIPPPKRLRRPASRPVAVCRVNNGAGLRRKQGEVSLRDRAARLRRVEETKKGLFSAPVSSHLLHSARYAADAVVEKEGKGAEKDESSGCRC